MTDTTVAVQRRYDEMIGALTPSERVRMASRMFDTGRKLATAGILRDDPDIRRHTSSSARAPQQV